MTAGEGGQAEEDEDDRDTSLPMTYAGLKRPWIPLVVAGAAAAVMIVGYLMAWPGLFPTLRAGLEEGAVLEIAIADRLLACGRFVVWSAVWTTCTFAALAATSWMNRRPMGELGMALARLLAIVTCARLIGFARLEPLWLEQMLVSLGEVAVVGLLVRLWFRVSWRELLTFLATTIAAFLLLLAMSHAVIWSLA